MFLLSSRQTWIKMPKWTVFEISFLWKYQYLCFHYWDYLTNFWCNNWRFVIDVVERLCLGVELKSPLQLKSEKKPKTRVINFQNLWPLLQVYDIQPDHYSILISLDASADNLNLQCDKTKEENDLRCKSR